MTFIVQRTKVGDDYEARVAAHVKALEAHRYTNAGEPRPTEHPLVEAAIRRVQHPHEAERPDDFVPDFKVEEPRPVPPEEKRARLSHRLGQVVDAKVREITGGHAKHHLRHLTLGQLAQTRADMHEKALQLDPAAEYPKPTAEERDLADEHNAVSAKVSVLHHRAAELAAEIEDLPDDKLDTWKCEL